LIFLCAPILTYAQYVRPQNIGHINDPDGFTFIRKGLGNTTPIVDTLFNSTFFIFYPNDSSNWTKVNKQFFKGIKSTEFVHNSRITNLNILNKHAQFVLLDSVFNKEIELQTKYSHKSREYFSISDKFHEEKFNLLLPIFISYFCKHNDVALLDKYLNIMVIESDSPDELPSFTLVHLFICQPNLVLERMKIIKDESIDWALEGYFGSIPEINYKIDNYSELEQLLNENFNK